MSSDTGAGAGDAIDTAFALPTGTIAPWPPFDKVDAGSLGPLDKATVKTYLPGQDFETSVTSLAEGFVHGTVPQDEVKNGMGLVLVFVGAYPGIAAGAFWHKLTVTVLKADP
jgi:hypothetical protein